MFVGLLRANLWSTAGGGGTRCHAMAAGAGVRGAARRKRDLTRGGGGEETENKKHENCSWVRKVKSRIWRKEVVRTEKVFKIAPSRGNGREGGWPRRPATARARRGPGTGGRYLLVFKEGSEEVLALVSRHGFVAGIA